MGVEARDVRAQDAPSTTCLSKTTTTIVDTLMRAKFRHLSSAGATGHGKLRVYFRRGRGRRAFTRYYWLG